MKIDSPELLALLKSDLTPAQIAERLKVRQVKPAAPVAVAPTPAANPYKGAHFLFPLLLAAVESGVDAIALVGPAGTGKTTAARVAAEITGRAFEPVSFSEQTSKSDLFGFIDAGGTYRSSALVRAATGGGLFLGDELDAGNPGVVVGLNMVTANPCFGTPTGVVQKHARFCCVVGMNTYGSGATREYVGRNRLDAASMDRMAFIDWPIDESIEARFCGVANPELYQPTFNLKEGGVMSEVDWFRYVRQVRQAVAALGIRHIVGPRASINGAKLLRAGIGFAHVKRMALWKGLDSDSILKIERNL